MSMTKRLLITAVAVVLIACLSLSLVGCKSNSSSGESSSNRDYDDDRDSRPEDTETYAETYYESNGEVFASVYAEEADDVPTEADTCRAMDDLGFVQFPVTSSYTMDGEYYSAQESDRSAQTKHPIYETYYIAENGDIWTIFVINGVVMANPTSYNLQSGLGVKVIVSESESVMSYDSTSNKFFETVPNESALLVLSVDKIDAAALDALTVEEIDKYVK